MGRVQLPDLSLWHGVRLSLVAVIGIQIGPSDAVAMMSGHLQGQVEMTLGNGAVV
jgi:hypothetical protein